MPSVADEKDAIRDVMARYAHNLDAGRFTEVAAKSRHSKNGHSRMGVEERAVT